MAYPEYIRERAIQMRVERDLSIDEIAERLAIPRTTIYYWVKDIPKQQWTLATERAVAATKAKHQALRDEAYEQGWADFYDELVEQPTFRDFVTLYIAEGSKRNRNRVALGNSDPTVVAIATGWLRRLSERALHFQIQYHADQDLYELRTFWAATLEIDPAAIRVQRKSNSNQMTGRTWRSEHGVLTVGADETLLRARLQAWMDRIRAGWTLDSAGPARGVAEPGTAHRLGR